MPRVTMKQQIADLTKELREESHWRVNLQKQVRELQQQNERASDSINSKLQSIKSLKADNQTHQETLKVIGIANDKLKTQVSELANQVMDKEAVNRNLATTRLEALQMVQIGLHLFVPEIYLDDADTSDPKSRWIMRIFDILKNGPRGE